MQYSFPSCHSCIFETSNKTSPSTESLYLSQIVQDGLVEIKLEKLRKRYYIKSKQLVDQLIEDYRPRILEKPTSRFEDIFNSF